MPHPAYYGIVHADAYVKLVAYTAKLCRAVSSGGREMTQTEASEPRRILTAEKDPR